MKRIIMMAFAATALWSMPSCKDGADDGKTLIVKDSLVNVFPTWQAAKIAVDNRTEMNVVIGDATFYTATPEEKAKKAEELGKMVLRIYGKGNVLEKGNLIVTKDTRNESPEPKDGVSTPIPFEALKKAGN